jgi:hypothetical protein
MPWRECCKMDERLRFVARLLEGEKMAVLCREFDISRKTGYKLFARYKDCGVKGLTDRSRRPYRHANGLSLPRSHGHSDELRAHLPGRAQDQLESCFRGPGGRHQGSRREDLAGDLHALRLGLLRSRNRARRMRAESIRGTGVTYVSGIKRHLCDRNGPHEDGAPGQIRTGDLRLRRPTLYPAELRARSRGER